MSYAILNVNCCCYLIVGLSRLVAEKQFLELAATLDHWGVCYTRVRQQQDTCFLGIGGHYIRLCNKEWKLIKRSDFASCLVSKGHHTRSNFCRATSRATKVSPCMVQSRAVASRLKHVCDMLREIETILFSGDLLYETCDKSCLRRSDKSCSVYGGLKQ